MTEQLHERLAELAGDAATPAPLDPAGLWRTGKRRQRRRTAAAAVAACAVVLAGVSGVGLLLPSADLSPGPSATKGAPALPDRLYAPSRWLESNDDDPVGPFAVLAQDQRQSSPDGMTYVGVSAATGEYRRVELPQVRDDAMVNDGSAVLSPSGRYIAYWAAVAHGPVDPDGGRVDGRLGVYDTVTGRDLDRRWTLADADEAPHGLAAWDLRWVDDTRVYVQAGALQGEPGTDAGSGSRALGAGWVVDLADNGQAQPMAVPGGTKAGEVLASDGAGHLLVRAKGTAHGYLFVDPTSPRTARSVRVVLPGLGGTSAPLWASDDGRVAMATQTEHGDAVLAVTGVDGTSRVFDKVPAWGLYGWSDGRHVVAGVSTPVDAEKQKASVVDVDVETGTARRLVALPTSGLNPPQLAHDLLGTPPAHRGEPDWPTDPRIFQALAAGGVALLLGALVIWRRREQR